MESSILYIFFIIIFLIFIYYYRSYKYSRYITENFDTSSEEDQEFDLKDLLNNKIFLNTNKGIKLGGIVTDYGNIINFKYVDILIKEPDTIEELHDIVKDAYNKKEKIRIRGGGYSCSGISIPKKDEVYIDMRRLIRYDFNQVGTILVEAGVLMNDLKRFLENQGFKLPIFPYGIDILNKISPSVGGYICTGGISPDSEKYGGFWENVLEITLIDGYGRKNVYNHNNEIFPWLFANYGQLGVIVSAKLRIEHIEKNKDFYPLGKKGIIEKFKFKVLDRKCFFYHILCSKDDVDQSEKNIKDIINSEYSTDENKRNLEIIKYFIKFNNFNPPLLYKNRSFYCVHAIQYIDNKDNEYKEKLKRIENKFSKLMEDNSLSRYPQIEYLDTETLKDYHINRGSYDKFLIYKNQMDPNGMFNQIDNFSQL